MVFVSATLNLTFMHAQPGHAHGLRAASSRNRRALGAALVLIAGFTHRRGGGRPDRRLARRCSPTRRTCSRTPARSGWRSSRPGWRRRPATPRRSFGSGRAEILAALVNGVALVAVSIWIFVAALGRLDDPPEVSGGWVLVVGVVGPRRQRRRRLDPRARGNASSLNVQAALLHVLADLLGSVGVIVAGLVVAGRRGGSTPTRWSRSRSACSCSRARGGSCATRSASCSRRRLPGSTPRRSGARWRARTASSRCTTCTSGRSRRASPPSPRTCSSSRAATATGVRRELERLLHERFELDAHDAAGRARRR